MGNSFRFFSLRKRFVVKRASILLGTKTDCLASQRSSPYNLKYITPDIPAPLHKLQTDYLVPTINYKSTPFITINLFNAFVI